VWQFALISNLHGLMIRFDLNASGSGTIDQQNPLDFSASSIAGNYSFGLSGVGNGPLSIAGLLYADSHGNFPLTIGSGHLTEEDINYNGIVTGPTYTTADQTLYGSYVFDSANSNTGRGYISLTNSSTVFSSTASPTTFSFVFYMIDATHLKLVESDTSFFLAGDFFSAPNTDGSFTASILKGKYPFTTGGVSSNGPYSSAGVLISSGGSASTTSGTISGVFDVNNSGSVNLDQTITSSSTYTVDPNLGRIALALTINGNTLNFAAYPTSTGSFELVEIDPNLVTSGIAYLQTAGASLQGSYALNLSGVGSTKNGTVEQDVIGQIATGTGGSLNGTIDINNFQDHGISEGLALLNGTGIVTPDSNLRGTLTLKTSVATFPLAYYIVDNNTILLFETDSVRVLPGTLVKQY
jgi:hypothetical protein